MKKYDSYKNSDIAWLGEIPKHWNSRRIKDLIINIGSGVTPKGGSEVYVNEGIVFLRSQNIYDDGLRIDNVSFIDRKTHNAMKSSQLKKNDILVNITGASIGRSCIVPENIKEANINQHIIFIRTKSKYSRFTANYFKSNFVKEYINIIQAGTSKEALNMGQTVTIPIVIPSDTEQISIAEYLDTKTQAIDKKIALLGQKITHYKDLRKSLINQVVTKGLDKNVKLKDSEIDWIGKIPEHWEVFRFKSFAKTIKGKNMEMSNINFENSLPLLSLEYLRNDNVKFDTFCFTNDKSLIASENDLIVVWDGAAAGEILKAKHGYVSSTIAKIDINKKKISSRYFYFLKDNIEYMLQNIPTGMGIPHLNPTILNNYPCPSPPLNEQLEIADYLEKNTTSITSIITNIELQINTLKELRKTLLNEVVTGKIKVI